MGVRIFSFTVQITLQMGVGIFSFFLKGIFENFLRRRLEAPFSEKFSTLLAFIRSHRKRVGPTLFVVCSYRPHQTLLLPRPAVYYAAISIQGKRNFVADAVKQRTTSNPNSSVPGASKEAVVCSGPSHYSNPPQYQGG